RRMGRRCRGSTVADIAAVMATAMDTENRRRELASQAPGVGALLPLPQPVAGPGVGPWDIPGLGMAGEGDAVTAPDAPLQVVTDPVPVYGERPTYAADEVGGIGFQGGRQEAPIRVFTGQRSIPTDGAVFVSPSPRPSLWARLFRRNVQR